ncbi:MAG: nitroreductase family protein [Candidatus Ancillula sp.]|jgi:nitroreductase|nr:nitroreductase family protein [Candidatus Ancillula sp.]
MSNQVLDAMKNRFTTRSFESQKVNSEDLNLICQAGLQSPSAVNRQPWKIIAVNNSDLIAELEGSAMNKLSSDSQYEMFYKNIQKRKEAGQAATVFYNTPCMIYIFIDPVKGTSLESAERDCGIVCENITLAAESLGYGTCINGMAKLPFDTEKEEYFRSKLQIPEGYQFGVAVLVGKTKSGKEPHPTLENKLTIIE